MVDKSFDELLAELDLEEEKDQEQAPVPQEKTDNFKQLRDYTKRQERELKQLREFREATVQRERLSTLQAAGLTEAQSNVYLKAYEEVTPEGVEAFKTNVLGVAAPAPEAVPETTPETKSGSFAPSAPQGGMGPSLRMYTQDEWDQLFNTNPQEAFKVQQEGRIIRPNANVQWRGTGGF